MLPCRAGRDVLARHGFGAEAGTSLGDSASEDVADLVRSAHAPYSNREGRLSIADVDDSMRESSIGQIEDYIDLAHVRFPNLEKINMHCSPKRWASETRPLTGDYTRLIDAIRRNRRPSGNPWTRRRCRKQQGLLGGCPGGPAGRPGRPSRAERIFRRRAERVDRNPRRRRPTERVSLSGYEPRVHVRAYRYRRGEAKGDYVALSGSRRGTSSRALERERPGNEYRTPGHAHELTRGCAARRASRTVEVVGRNASSRTLEGRSGARGRTGVYRLAVIQVFEILNSVCVFSL